MEHRWAVRGLGAAVVVAILAGAGGAVRAAAPAAEPWVSLHRTLLGVQNSVSNVSSVLEHGVRGVTPAPGKTWFEACCSYNVERVRTGMVDLRRGLDYLEAQYAKLRNLEAIGQIQAMRKHLDEVETIFLNMGNSVNPRDAQDRLLAIIHPFNHVRRTVTSLEACCPVDPPPSTSDAQAQ